jgi:glycosyltransferase involved in cell wall biosynthesis
MEKNFEEILVSVPVITYNSSKYVLETLESIKAQTYQNIELIISDDCSTDNTVEICRKWIEENKSRFVRTELITSDVNTGVSANGNRGRNACRGEWIKSIAGDDLLMPNCIESYVNYVKQTPEAIYIFSKVEAFGAESIRCEKYNMESSGNLGTYECSTAWLFLSFSAKRSGKMERSENALGKTRYRDQL